MRYINTFNEGDNVQGIYLCKQKNSAVTKNGKEYDNLTIADKTATVNAKIWDPNGMGIGDFDVNDYIEIHGKVSLFNGALQVSIDRAFKASEGSYNPSDYLPVSPKDPDKMWAELISIINSVKAPYYKELLQKFFLEDEDFAKNEGLAKDEGFAKSFRNHSAAKTVHHGFVGGLLQHTLSVAKICDFLASQYDLLNRDLLITAAILHDIGKTKELSDFPLNDYTDEGQLLGHIMMGTVMITEKAKEVPDFPEVKKNELLHCILAHHGELEFGSPKVPALVEAVALSHADNIDAKIEVFTEALENSQTTEDGWLGFNKFLNSNIRKTK